MSQFYPTRQQSAAPAVTPGASSAVLALKRFMRGPLRQLGIGLVSLVILLNVSVHTPEAILSPPSHQFTPEATVTAMAQTAMAQTAMAQTHANHSQFQSIHSGNASAHQRSTLTPTQSAKASESSTVPPHLLRAHMTHHRLTGSRLSLPTAHVTKLADAS